MPSGRTIRLLRTASGRSQKTLAHEIGVTSAYLSQIERERRKPSLSFLKGVSRALRVPLILLVDHEDDVGERSELIRGQLNELFKELLNGYEATSKSKRTR